ncbi:MAG: CoA-binding protein [Gammaproteobacteria bacterium]|nr:CoA-binding protein [Gammaproteobacteria bacterium]MCZ6894481.1 CoA-binding protein [Gammaproteobacteria bacterium]
MSEYAGIMTGALSERPKHILTTYRRIAMVGVSASPTRASYRAMVHMLSKGYTVYPINPRYEEIQGVRCYDSLLELDQPVDIVDIFRRGDTVMPLVDEAKQIGAKVFWMQIGVINDEAAAAAEKAGMEVIMDRCVKIEQCRFFGKKDYGLDVVGLNTGVISANRVDCHFKFN